MTETEAQRKPLILFIDDDIETTANLLRRLAREEPSYDYESVHTAEAAIAFIHKQTPEVVVVDLELDSLLGPESGLQLIAEVFRLDPSCRVLALTGHEATEFGVRAIRAGAASFLQKPASVPHLLALIRDGIMYAELKRQFLRLQSAPTEISARLGLSSRNRAMLEVLQQACFAASNSLPVLLLGETGTGKGVLARAIHKLSPRSKGHFIRVQPQFGSPELAASELFGHSRGAFTGALSARKGLLQEADRGSLFLDEVDQLSSGMQVTLLETLQEKTFRPIGSNAECSADFRLFCASNKPAESLVAPDALRQDFYHRIAQCTITLPPLRKRPEDVPDLAHHFLSQLADRENIAVNGFCADAVEWLTRQLWPGNIRQLQSTVESAAYKAAFHNQTLIDLPHLNLQSSDTQVGKAAQGHSFREKVQEFEEDLVRKAMQEHDNNQSKAAHSIQLDRSSFRRILNRSK